MLRILLCVIIVSASLFIGVYCSERLSKRCKTLTNFLFMIENAHSRIRSTHSTLAQVFADNFLGYHFRTEISFADQWKDMMSQCRDSLTADDIGFLISFAEGLGISDVTSQLQHITMYKEMLSERIESAKAEQDKKSNLYLILPFSIGLTVVILLL